MGSTVGSSEDDDIRNLLDGRRPTEWQAFQELALYRSTWRGSIAATSSAAS
jgi:hypothetical protein